MKSKADQYLIGGLGITGQALMKYFQSQKTHFIGFEEQSAENYQKALQDFKEDGRFFFKELPNEVFDHLKGVLVSPGVPMTRQWIQEALKREIPVLGELEFASLLIQGQILGVTGTNGKSTTVSLLDQILRGRTSIEPQRKHRRSTDICSYGTPKRLLCCRSQQLSA